MRQTIIYMLISLLHFGAAAQKDSLPVKEWNSPGQNPLLLYISGDGGFNSFSTQLCEQLNKRGYDVTAVNSKTYFWNKKTPEQTAAYISEYVERKFAGRSDQHFFLVGYSFGADVMPFIVNRLPQPLKNKLAAVVMISPSTSTDFEIHWSDMFGGNAKRSMDVLAEINKMTVPKLATFFGADEVDFPARNITLKNYRNQTLPGGHRFDGNTDELAAAVVNELK